MFPFLALRLPVRLACLAGVIADVNADWGLAFSPSVPSALAVKLHGGRNRALATRQLFVGPRDARRSITT